MGHMIQLSIVVGIIGLVSPASAQQQTIGGALASLGRIITEVVPLTDKYDCNGDFGARRKSATKEMYDRLDRELEYAEKALGPSEISKLQGLWEGKFKDENFNDRSFYIEFKLKPEPYVNRTETIYFDITLKDWGQNSVNLSESAMITNESKSYLVATYQGIPGIELRPISPNKMRYAFHDTCALNFPNQYDTVFTRVVPKRVQVRRK